MALDPWTLESPTPAFKFYTDQVDLRTKEPFQFVDLTELVAERVRRSGVANGLVNVHTRHTTTGLIVNENEPGLLDDLAGLLARLAPREARYRHDELARRPLCPPEEPLNGHAHLRSVILGSSVTLNLIEREVGLGRWQRIFLVELDGGRRRSLSIGVLGLTSGAAPSDGKLRVV